MINKKIQKSIGLFLMPIFVLMTFPLVSGAQDEKTGILKGFVYMNNRKSPVKDAAVILYNDDAGNNREYSSQPTPSTGDYLLETIPAGIYKVKIHYKGNFYYQNKKIKINQDQTGIAYFYRKNKNKKFELLNITPATPLIASFILTKRRAPLYIIIPGTIAASLAGVALFTPATTPPAVSPVEI